MTTEYLTIKTEDSIVNKIHFLCDLEQELINEDKTKREVTVNNKVYLITRSEVEDGFIIKGEEMWLEEVIEYFANILFFNKK